MCGCGGNDEIDGYVECWYKKRYRINRTIDSTGDGEVYFEDFVEATNKKVDVDYKAKDVIKAFDFSRNHFIGQKVH